MVPSRVLVPRMVSYNIMLFTWSNDKFRNYGIRISTIFLTNLDMFYHWLLLLFFVQCDWRKHSEKFRICSFEIGSGEQYSLQMTKFSVQSANFVYLLLERSKFPPTCLGKFWLVLGKIFLTNQRRPHVWADITSI